MRLHLDWVGAQLQKSGWLAGLTFLSVCLMGSVSLCFPLIISLFLCSIMHFFSALWFFSLIAAVYSVSTSSQLEPLRVRSLQLVASFHLQLPLLTAAVFFFFFFYFFEQILKRGNLIVSAPLCLPEHTVALSQRGSNALCIRGPFLIPQQVLCAGQFPRERNQACLNFEGLPLT